MSPRLLAGAGLNHKIVAGLRRKEPSVTFISAFDGGIIGEPDPIVLGMAATLDCVLVSHHRKTMPRHFAKFINSINSIQVPASSSYRKVSTLARQLSTFC